MNTSHPADATLRQGPEFPFGSGKGAGVVSVLCGALPVALFRALGFLVGMPWEPDGFLGELSLVTGGILGCFSLGLVMAQHGARR